MLYSLFSDLKDVISSTLHLSRDALHVHIGLMVFLAGAALLRGPRRFGNSFLALLALCLAGEIADAAGAWSDVGGPNWLGGVKDIVNTMFWPAAGLLAWPHIVRMIGSGQVSAAVRGSRPEARSGSV